MSLPRTPKPTVAFVDQYCAHYQEVFPEVRNFEQFKYRKRSRGHCEKCLPGMSEVTYNAGS